jgi:hypothetical protein
MDAVLGAQSMTIKAYREYVVEERRSTTTTTYELLALLLGLLDLGDEGGDLAAQSLLKLAASTALDELGQLTQHETISNRRRLGLDKWLIITSSRYTSARNRKER